MPEAAGLSPWREVLQPHEDVATGNFQAAEFAADLYKVSVTSVDAGKDYADPVEFFSRTYLTEGLSDLISRAVRRLGGDDNASPVINLQTNFGGGKTHSMLALWHLAARLDASEYGQDIQELLEGSGYGDLPAKIGRVALVGNHISPSGEPKSDGTQVNTLWGELGWQLGGKEGYAMVAQADSDRTPPGEALHKLIAACAPAVILIDEWVAYARSLVGRDDLAGGSFDDQFTFAQSLTEAVKGTCGVLLAISIPASESGDDAQHLAAGNAEEVGGAHGLEALRRLQNVVRRVADQWRAASADESYRIVRQRLFVPETAESLASISATGARAGIADSCCPPMRSRPLTSPTGRSSCGPRSRRSSGSASRRKTTRAPGLMTAAEGSTTMMTTGASRPQSPTTSDPRRSPDSSGLSSCQASATRS
jgi:predicted AAA+ superfamily ATPase